MDAIKYFYDHPDQWDVIVNLMDDDLREKVHGEVSPCGNWIFLTAYCKEHKIKYGKSFDIN